MKQAASSVEESCCKFERGNLIVRKHFMMKVSVADSRKLDRKELLALKGIGPATIKKLKELGVKFK